MVWHVRHDWHIFCYKILVISMRRWLLLRRILGLDSKHIGEDYFSNLPCFSLIGLFSQSIWWFNPFFWWFFRSLDDVRMNLEVLKYCATVLFLVKTNHPSLINHGHPHTSFSCFICNFVSVVVVLAHHWSKIGVLSWSILGNRYVLSLDKVTKLPYFLPCDALYQ